MCSVSPSIDFRCFAKRSVDRYCNSAFECAMAYKDKQQRCIAPWKPDVEIMPMEAAAYYCFSSTWGIGCAGSVYIPFATPICFPYASVMPGG
jgi:hypothetical protein